MLSSRASLVVQKLKKFQMWLLLGIHLHFCRTVYLQSYTVGKGKHRPEFEWVIVKNLLKEIPQRFVSKEQGNWICQPIHM